MKSFNLRFGRLIMEKYESHGDRLEVGVLISAHGYCLDERY